MTPQDAYEKRYAHIDNGQHTWEAAPQHVKNMWLDAWTIAWVIAESTEREAIIGIIENYRIPVGNSASGEMACRWTYDALHEIRDEIRARGKHEP